jgi:hypothetical protein
MCLLFVGECAPVLVSMLGRMSKCVIRRRCCFSFLDCDFTGDLLDGFIGEVIWCLEESEDRFSLMHVLSVIDMAMGQDPTKAGDTGISHDGKSGCK